MTQLAKEEITIKDYSNSFDFFKTTKKKKKPRLTYIDMFMGILLACSMFTVSISVHNLEISNNREHIATEKAAYLFNDLQNELKNNNVSLSKLKEMQEIGTVYSDTISNQYMEMVALNDKIEPEIKTAAIKTYEKNIGFGVKSERERSKSCGLDMICSVSYKEKMVILSNFESEISENLLKIKTPEILKKEIELSKLLNNVHQSTQK